MSESAFTSLYKHWIWIGPPVFVLALAALVYLILNLVATVRKAHLFKVPLSELQEVQFGEAGRVVLSTEGPRLSRRFAGVKLELRGIDGDPVQCSRALFRAPTSGVSTARTEVAIFEIPVSADHDRTGRGTGDKCEARGCVHETAPDASDEVCRRDRDGIRTPDCQPCFLDPAPARDDAGDLRSREEDNA